MNVIDFNINKKLTTNAEEHYKAIVDFLTQEVHVKKEEERPAVIFFQEIKTDKLLNLIRFLLCGIDPTHETTTLLGELRAVRLGVISANQLNYTSDTAKLS